MRQQYHPAADSRTVYYLNHHSWWDGLIPFLLNEFHLHQQARAMMEEKQMRKYPFFKKIGAFSVDLEQPRSSIPALRYAVSSMKRDNASLFIYPQGEITHAGAPLEFKKGLAWIFQQLPECDFVPVGIHIHTIRSDKPELHLYINNKIDITKDKSLEEITLYLQKELENTVEELCEYAGFEDRHFDRIL